jgi:hypothetical protein
MKVYLPLNQISGPLLSSNRSNELTFLYGSKDFSFTNDLNLSEVIPLEPTDHIKKLDYLKENLNNFNKIILILQETHMTDGDSLSTCHSIIKEYQNVFKYVFYVTINYGVKGYKNIIYNDYCFNRQKAYFTEYDNYDFDNRLWTGPSNKDCFKLHKLEKHNNFTKKFLIPNNLYNRGDWELDTPRLKARSLLHNFINDIDCYYSYPQKDIYLLPENPIEKLLDSLFNMKQGTGFIPIANNYYDTSIVSAYGETVVASEHGSRLISEKTFNPLIKGHFILPLAYCGIIDDLKDIYGFKFPNWIDYSYDKYVDTEKRFVAYQESLNNIRNTPIERLIELRNKDLVLLEHNRSIFFNRDYDSLYSSLSEKLMRA